MPNVAITVRTKDHHLFLKRALANIAEHAFTNYAVSVVKDSGSRELVEQPNRVEWALPLKSRLTCLVKGTR